MKKQFCLVWILLLVSAGMLWAGGDKGFQFLRVGMSARAAALGESYVAMPGDLSTAMYNPAGLVFLSDVGGERNRHASFTYLNHLVDIQSGHLAYGQPFRDLGFFGAGLTYFGYGDFEGFDVNGNPTGEFGATDFALNFYHAKRVEYGVSYGVTVKYIHSSIDEFSSNAVALDLGLLYEPPVKGLTAGASLLNVGRVFDAYVDTKDPLPVSLQFGVSKVLDKAPITVNASMSDVNLEGSFLDRVKRFAVGVELKPSERFLIRAGFDNHRREELDLNTEDFLDKISGVSLGFGVNIGYYSLDYSFSSWGIGALNRISLFANF